MTPAASLPDDLGPTAMVDEVVDWGLAAATARRLARPGPQVGRGEAQDLVASLRESAVLARGHVAGITGMPAPDPGARVLVVDRPRWVEANLTMLRAMLEPVVEKMAAKRSPSAVVREVGSKLTGAEAGGLLSFLSTKVLGQYDIAPGAEPRLLLVAPNILAAEREMGLDPDDFRLWVCLHEETHRVQFTAVPWLRGHVLDLAASITQDLAPEDGSDLQARLAQVVQRLPDAFRGDGNGIVEVLTTPEQRERLAEVTAVMSLLEGHADVVMDEVGPSVVPSVETIRARFQQRRAGADAVDRLLRRLLGLEAKMRQYRDGAAFVRGVVDEVGMDGFNAVWTSPETLPRPAEVTDPASWVRRVHG